MSRPIDLTDAGRPPALCDGAAALRGPPADDGPVRVAIADDSPHLRAGLRALAAGVGAEVVAAVGRGCDLVDVVTGAPDDAPVQIALVDMRMPPTHDDEGLRAAQQIRALRPATAVLVFSADDEAPYAAELLTGAPGGDRLRPEGHDHRP